MTDDSGRVEVEVELDRSDVDFIDRMAVSRKCSREALIHEAIMEFIGGVECLVRERAQAKTKEGGSRTGHTAASPPKRSE